MLCTASAGPLATALCKAAHGGASDDLTLQDQASERRLCHKGLLLRFGESRTVCISLKAP